MTVKTQKDAANTHRKGMWQLGFTYPLREMKFSSSVESKNGIEIPAGQFHQPNFISNEPNKARPFLLSHNYIANCKTT